MDTSMDTKHKNTTRKQKGSKTKNNSTLSHINYDFPLKRIFHFVNPFLRGLTSMDKEPEAQLFTYLVGTILIYADLCNTHDLWDTKYKVNKRQIDKNKNALKKIRKKIQAILEGFIPSYDTSKKEHIFLILCRLTPELLVEHVELWVKGIEPFMTEKSYKGKRHQKETDVKKFYTETSKKPFPKKIKIDYSSKWTIALSFISYQEACDYRKLLDIYYKVPIRRRKELADTV